MEYTQIKTSVNGRVGIITLAHAPYNAMSKLMIVEILDALKDYEKDDNIRCVMVNAEGKYFSAGADGDDITAALAKGDLQEKASETAELLSKSFSVLGNMLVERIDNYPKPTLVAAQGKCMGGSTAIFNAFDIRIVSSNFQMHDGDIYYGTVGSWGMSSLRLPMWIGRNKVMDYMFLNEDFTGEQCYELGLVSKVVPDDALGVMSMQIAQKMAKAAPIAVRYFKECVRKATETDIDALRAHELEAADIVNATEDSKRGLASVVANNGVPDCEFYGK